LTFFAGGGPFLPPGPLFAKFLLLLFIIFKILLQNKDVREKTIQTKTFLFSTACCLLPATAVPVRGKNHKTEQKKIITIFVLPYRFISHVIPHKFPDWGRNFTEAIYLITSI
jgi:hypothetical protein